jgi:hypothetical protein
MTSPSGKPDAVTDAYRRAFRNAQVRALLNYIFMLSLPALAWMIRGAPPKATWTLPDSPIYLVIFLAWLGYHYYNWRCPRCGAFQGHWVFSAECDECGLKGA